MKILVINGPNLNLLGTREVSVYGTMTYKNLERELIDYGKSIGVECEVIQKNIEGEIVEEIHRAYMEKIDGIVINPAAYTHYSIAILDALKGVDIPTVEVHISNIHKREEFRHISYPAKAAIGQICGLGMEGYKYAMDFLKNHINKQKSTI